MMRTEIEKSAAALTELDEQAQMVKDTHKEFNMYGDSMNQSRGILMRLGRRETYDKWMIWFGLFVFICTIIFIIQRRLWIPSLLNPWKWKYNWFQYWNEYDEL